MADAQVIVVGGGPAGLTSALALAQQGVQTTLLADRLNAADNRTTALLAGSVAALDKLGVWPACAPHAAALRLMRIVDDTGRLLRAPEVRFDAGEISLDAFGYNIENRHLVAALAGRAAALASLNVVETRVQSIECDPAHVRVRSGAGVFSAPLLIGADGRQSKSRSAAGIEADTRKYSQSALTVMLTHGRPHRDTSTEFHTPGGPFTLVPLPGQRSSLVWVMSPREAERIAALDDGALAGEIERCSHSILGKITVEPGRGLFPLSMTLVHRFAANRIALAGEAAHVLPPIGAQGLNLGLRDAATIAELVIEAVRRDDDPGAAHVLAEYDRRRRADVAGRSMAVDLLNRSLLSDFLPVHGIRGAGLYALDRIGPLRRAVMREGVAPSAAEPRLMRGAAS